MTKKQRKRREKILVIIFKTSTILSILNFVLFGVALYGFSNEKLAKTFIILSFGFCFIMMITTSFGSYFLEEDVKKVKKKLNITSYEDFKLKLEEEIKKYDYKLKYETDDNIIYTKEEKRKVSFINIVKIDKLTNKKFDDIDIFFGKFLSDNYPDNIGEQYGKQAWFLPIICIEEESKCLKDFLKVNGPSVNVAKLPIVINLKTNEMYINNGKPIYGKKSFGKLKDHFEEMFSSLIK